MRDTRPRLRVVAFGTRHTLASYLSMQPVPDTTASGGHAVSGPLGGPAAASAPAAPTRTRAAAAATFLVMRLMALLSLLAAHGTSCRAWILCPVSDALPPRGDRRSLRRPGRPRGR